MREREKRCRSCARSASGLLPQVKGVALVPVSAMTGEGLDRLMQAVLEVDATVEHAGCRPMRSTNGCRRRRCASAAGGRRAAHQAPYMTQANARPPTFVLFCSRPKALPDSYSRYLVNALRESFDMPGVPIRLQSAQGRQSLRPRQGVMSGRAATEVYFYHLERRSLERRAADAAPAVAQARLARRGAGGERGARRGAEHVAMDL